MVCLFRVVLKVCHQQALYRCLCLVVVIFSTFDVCVCIALLLKKGTLDFWEGTVTEAMFPEGYWPHSAP